MLFNLFGYSMVADFLENRVSSEFQAQLDQDHYSEGDLIRIKVPLTIPYVSGSLNFEKTEGSIEIKGISYQYVKKRIYRDTLEVLCLPNNAKTALIRARNHFNKLASDFDSQTSSKKPVSPLSHKIKLSGFDFTNDHIIYSSLKDLSSTGRYYSFGFLSSSSILLKAIDQPPEA